jgi:hypothetical protein
MASLRSHFLEGLQVKQDLLKDVRHLILQGRPVPRKRLTVFACGLLLLTLTSSGCSTIKKATSEAYNIGYKTGQDFANLGDVGTLINSYLPDDSDTQLGDFSEEEVAAYCDSIWIISGLTAGIMNSAENKSDFVSGCVDGLNSKP